MSNNILAANLKELLTSSVFDEVSKLNLNVSSTVLQGIVTKATDQMVGVILDSVSANTGKQLQDIPQNLIGIKNPVNIITDNLGSTGLNNNISNIINTQLTPQLTKTLVNTIQGELKLSLPSSVINLINFNNLSSTLTSTLTSTVKSSINTTLKSVTDSIFSRGITSPSILSSVDTLFGSLSAEQALSQIDKQFATTTSLKYFNLAKNFQIDNPDNQDKLVTLESGFIDPSANYPTKEYSGLSETNKLAQGDVKGTVVQKKNITRMVGARLPGGVFWEQPESPYRGEYPYNKVTQTESGHIIEIDDTPGAERLHVYHKSGTFIEIDVNGSVTKRAVGSVYEIIDRNGKISISGSADVSINGACNIYVGNDANIEVDGDTNLVCHNDITAQAGGTFNLSAVEEFNIASGNVNIEAYNTMNVKANVALLISTTQNLSLRSNTDVFLQATDLFQNTTNSYHQTISNIYEKVGENKYTQTTGDVHHKTGGSFNVDTGAEIYLNSGTSVDSKDSRPAVVAFQSNVGVISGRKDIISINVADPVSSTLSGPYALRLEEDLSTSEEYAAHKDLILTSGFATSAVFDSLPVELTRETSSSIRSEVISPSDTLINFKDLPGNYNISPNFTLEMLSSRASLTRHILESSEEVNFGEVVYNLSAVALNVLEPAYNLYPTLTVASGYRPKSVCSKNSLHPFGKCVDIQFLGASREDYYTYAVQLAKVINYDQFILHYCNYTSNPWIHISFVGTNNRRKVFTYWNNKVYSAGLAKLA